MIGKQLGHYAITDQVGRGGMATVYKAFQTGLDRPVALKILHQALAADDIIVKRFQQEARIAANLYHPSIVTIYDVGELEGLNYIAMRYIDGENLGQFLRREGPLEPERAFEMLGQVADALDFAHTRGILHRDIKPGNVLVEDGRRLTLTDFGIARASERAQLTATRMIIGTPEYMSPEQARGDPVDRRADLYAFGVMLYEAVGGRPPFSAASTPSLLYLHVHEPPPPIEKLRPNLPPALGAVLARALAKSPDDRFGSARETLAEARASMKGWASPASPRTLPTVVGPSDDTRETPPRPFPPAATPPPAVHPTSPAAAGRSRTRTLTPPPVAARTAPAAHSQMSAGAAPITAHPTDQQLATPTRSNAWLIGPTIVGLALLVVGAVVIFQSGVLPPGAPATATPAVAKPAATESAPAAPATTLPQVPAPATSVPAPAPATPVPPTAVPPTPAPPTAVPPTATPGPEQRMETAKTALADKEFAAALQILEGVRRTDPGLGGLDQLTAQVHAEYGVALLDQGKLDEAALQLESALKLAPQHPGALDGQKRLTLARNWAAMEAAWGKDDDAAIAALEQIMQVDADYRESRPKLYALLVAKADRLLGTGDRDGAFPVLMRALEVMPDGPEARQRLAAYTPTPVPAPQAPPPPAPRIQPAPQPAPVQPRPQPAPAPQPAPPQDRGRPV